MPLHHLSDTFFCFKIRHFVPSRSPRSCLSSFQLGNVCIVAIGKKFPLSGQETCVPGPVAILLIASIIKHLKIGKKLQLRLACQIFRQSFFLPPLVYCCLHRYLAIVVAILLLAALVLRVYRDGQLPPPLRWQSSLIMMVVVVLIRGNS